MEQHLPVHEVAAKLACCEETVRRMIRTGKLPALKVGSTYRVAGSTLVLSLQKQHGATRRNK